MALNGFKLTFGGIGASLDEQVVFRCSAEADVQHSGESLFLLDGRNNLVALFNEFVDVQGGQPGRSDSNLSGVFLGFGAGVHQIQVTFVQSTGASDTWGDINDISASSATAQELRDRLVRRLATIRMDSSAVGLLETGEYQSGSSGLYNEIPVAVLDWNIRALDIEGERPSEVQGSITFADSIDVDQEVAALEQLG